jgi:hypothetical protein
VKSYECVLREERRELSCRDKKPLATDEFRDILVEWAELQLFIFLYNTRFYSSKYMHVFTNENNAIARFNFININFSAYNPFIST